MRRHKWRKYGGRGMGPEWMGKFWREHQERVLGFVDLYGKPKQDMLMHRRLNRKRFMRELGRPKPKRERTKRQSLDEIAEAMEKKLMPSDSE